MQTVATDEFLTVAEVAQRLRVSPATVYRLASAEVLPAVQLAGPRSTIRISRGELEEWLYDTDDSGAFRPSLGRPIPAERGETSEPAGQSSSPLHAGQET
jgi:excisionase family DNA binding protein